MRAAALAASPINLGGLKQADAKSERRYAQHHQEKEDSVEICEFGEIGFAMVAEAQSQNSVHASAKTIRKTAEKNCIFLRTSWSHSRDYRNLALMRRVSSGES